MLFVIQHHLIEIIIVSAMSATFAYFIVHNSEIAMRLWQDFLDSFDSQGGHLLLLVLLLIVLPHLGLTDAQKFEGEVIGALLMGLSAARSNKTRRDTPTPPTVTDVAISTVSSQPAPVVAAPDPNASKDKEIPLP